MLPSVDPQSFGKWFSSECLVAGATGLKGFAGLEVEPASLSAGRTPVNRTPRTRCPRPELTPK